MCEVETLCPECELPFDTQLPRRGFLQAMSAGAAVALAGGTAASSALAFDEKAPAERGTPKPAESLIKELHASLNDEQKKTLVLPWNHGADGKPSRHGMYNRPFQNQRIGDVYSKPQTELVDRILHAICNGEEGYRQITRAGKFDSSQSLVGCGAHIFGTPGDDTKFAWMFSGHHLTVRCDGNSEPGAAFGGPMYYGHTAKGDSTGNVYHFQTRRVQELFESLDAEQQAQAVASGNTEGADSVRFRAADAKLPGISAGSLSSDQKDLAGRVMQDLVAPFRKEDGDEVMEIVKKNGGMDKVHLSYYKDASSKDGDVKWHSWRVEGPGFVWNFRVLPHVHCFVNISSEFKTA
ncbi:MAG: DUF3500 domain-containing protein [Planctomycetota bacterium]|nr:DUF3500 domain-containing protein [Planctomycetota bacterium]MDA1250576.1 DUF3500 domain-containing protein [Planctomycetota bacterium]